MQKCTHLNAGPVVCCDMCNCPGEDCYGGVILGSTAVCGCCCERYNSHTSPDADVLLNPTRTFKENILAYREQQYGSSDCVITLFFPDDDPEE